MNHRYLNTNPSWRGTTITNLDPSPLVRSSLIDYQIPSKNAQIKKSTIDTLVSGIPVPEIKLLAKDVANRDAVREVLETFNCMICYSIPIEPMECNKCDVLFCSKCIEKYKKNSSHSQAKKCPMCRESFEIRSMNRKLKQMTVETLTFEHRCL